MLLVIQCNINYYYFYLSNQFDSEAAMIAVYYFLYKVWTFQQNLWTVLGKNTKGKDYIK